MDLALQKGNYDIVDMINTTLQQEKKDQPCDFTCPQTKSKTEQAFYKTPNLQLLQLLSIK